MWIINAASIDIFFNGGLCQYLPLQPPICAGPNTRPALPLMKVTAMAYPGFEPGPSVLEGRLPYQQSQRVLAFRQASRLTDVRIRISNGFVLTFEREL